MSIRKPTAFTLIELLVVTSIISILIAMLLPALGKTQEVSRNVVCLNVLHGIGTATGNYAADNRQWPTAPPGSSVTPTAPSFTGEISTPDERDLRSLN